MIRASSSVDLTYDAASGANKVLPVNPAGVAVDPTTPTLVSPGRAAGGWTYVAASGGILNTTTAVTIKAAGAGVTKNYVTNIQIWSEALTTATEVAIRDGAGGTVLWRTKIPTGGLLGGWAITFNTPLIGTAATLLEVVTLTASGAGAVYFNAQGYTQ